VLETAPRFQGNQPTSTNRDFSRIPVCPSSAPAQGPPGPIQRKLEVGAINDPLEHEADRIANQVMSMSDMGAVVFPAVTRGGLPGVQRNCSCGGRCDKCKVEKNEDVYRQLQKKRAGPEISDHQASAPSIAPPIVHDVLRSPGQPLDPVTRAFFEPRFGFDFSKVRVHVDARAAASAKALHARAYTAGPHVVLAAGFSANAEGSKLLAHELTHVVQQTGPRDLSASRSGALQSIQSETATSPRSSTILRQPDDKDKEYIPSVAAAERQPTDPKKNVPEVLGRLDIDDLFKNNPKAKERVEAVAKELDLDPGLLAASLVAETATQWTRTAGKIASEVLGMDDWFGETATDCDAQGRNCKNLTSDPAVPERLKGIIAAHPGLGLKFEDVRKTGPFWNTATEKTGGLWKPRGQLDASKSVAAWGVYMKMEVNILRDALAKDPSLKRGPIRNLEDLTPEQRLTIERLAANAGVGFAKQMFTNLAAGGDIPRKGGTRRNPKNAFRTAVLHMARAVHLDQAIFGRSPDDYKPPAQPISHPEAAQLYDLPWLKDLPEWITPIDY
jgi:hypothetical protein